MNFRLRCFSLHLLLSLVMAALALSLVFLVWYPSPLDLALGVTSIFLLLLGVDVILGPLLTLLVAKKDKKTLKMDLLIIIVIQTAALLYGLYIVAQGRPVWIVYDSGKFELVQGYEVIGLDGEDVLPAFQYLPYSGPIWASVSPAGDFKLGENLSLQDQYLHAEYLIEYQQRATGFDNRAIPLQVLHHFNNTVRVDKILKKHPKADAYIPLQAKKKTLTVLVNKATGEPVAIVDLSPW